MCGMACQAMLRRPRRCRCSRTGWRHTCSAAATKLLDFELHFLFLVIISPPEQWSLQYFSLFRPLFANVYDDHDDDDEGLWSGVARMVTRSVWRWSSIEGSFSSWHLLSLSPVQRHRTRCRDPSHSSAVCRGSVFSKHFFCRYRIKSFDDDMLTHVLLLAPSLYRYFTRNNTALRHR